MLTLTAIVMTGLLHSAPSASPQSTTNTCLHESGTETADQAARKTSALGLARTINTAESAYSARFGSYGKLEDLVSTDFVKPAPPTGQYVAGFDIRIDVTDHAYWFEVADKTDPCGFRFISNQDGLIFTAEPIR